MFFIILFDESEIIIGIEKGFDWHVVGGCFGLFPQLPDNSVIPVIVPIFFSEGILYAVHAANTIGR